MKIKAAELVQAWTMNGSKVIGAKSINKEKYPGLELGFLTEGLSIKQGGVTGMVPWSNVLGVILEETPDKKK